MPISIISACTGNGHNAVMNTLAHQFKNRNCNIECYPTFYEDLMPSNRVLSNFYNLLQKTSIELCKKFTELAVLEGEETQNDLYKYYYKALDEFIKKRNHDAIISTTPLLNRYIIRYLKENNLNDKIPFYITITDPYDPMYPGFDVYGADAYFCANNIIKDILIKSGIKSEKIKVFGYPIPEKFCYKPSESEKNSIYKKFGLDPVKSTLLINSGVQGSAHYINIAKEGLSKQQTNLQIILICGNNKSLFKAAQMLLKTGSNNDILILPFIDNIEELLYIADVCITKAGANTVYECLSTCTPIIIDSTDGLLYQEKGIIDLLKSYQVGKVFNNLEELDDVLEKVIDGHENIKIKQKIIAMNVVSGSERIVESILDDINIHMKRAGEFYEVF